MLYKIYVKRCRTGELNINSGLVLKLTGSETSTYTQFNASEQATAGFRPYLVLTYSGDTTITLNTTKVEIDEKADTKLVATTSPADLDVDWSSSNTSVATISSTGILRARKAGVTRITAEIEGTDIRAYCSVYVTVADGIYVIKNMNNGMALDVENNGIVNNTNVLLCIKNSYCGGLNQCWRVKHLGSGYYSVRPLHKLDMCLYTDGSGVTIYSSSLNEHIDTTPTSKRWTITYEVIEGTTEKGYVFKTKSGTKALTYADISNSNNDNAVTSNRVLSDRKQYWTLSKDDSLPTGGTRMYDASRTGVFYDSNYHPGEMFAKDVMIGASKSLSSLNLVPVFYSSKISDSVNQNFLWLTSNSSVARVDNQSGKVTAQNVGVATITGSNNANDTIYSVSFTVAVVAMEDGTYFIKNREYGKYMQIDNNKSPNYNDSGSIMEQWDFDGGDYQKWNIISLKNGYHKIVSAKSGLALSVEAGKTNVTDTALVQESYKEEYRQQWRITKTAHGSYKIKARSSEGLVEDVVMAVGNSLADGSNGVNIEQRKYIDNNSYKDEWIFAYIGYESSVKCEGQKRSNWCWAASSRMFSKHFYPNVSYTQDDAVNAVKGSVVNVSGDRADAKAAIEYYISNISGAEIDTVFYDNTIYAEKTLLKFLDDGYVVYISRGMYSDMYNPASKIGGHATLIYGYTIIDSEYWFLVRDPMPVNKGETYMISYEKLCNGRQCRANEESDIGVWMSSVVVNTSYANDTIPYWFDK